MVSGARMIGLTNCEAYQSATKEIIERLEKTGFKNSVRINNQEIKNTKDVIFWQSACNNEDGAAKPIYITFYVYNTAVENYADNEIRCREVSVSINVWSTLKFGNNSLTHVLNKIENEFMADWEIELSTSSNENKFQANYSLFKNFYRR